MAKKLLILLSLYFHLEILLYDYYCGHNNKNKKMKGQNKK